MAVYARDLMDRHAIVTIIALTIHMPQALKVYRLWQVATRRTGAILCKSTRAIMHTHKQHAGCVLHAGHEVSNKARMGGQAWSGMQAQ
jgi:hypothetical protein